MICNSRNGQSKRGRKAANRTPQPASYWYLRGFDIIHLEQYVDWFNVMTYDIRKLGSPYKASPLIVQSN
jgi:chitinase